MEKPIGEIMGRFGCHMIKLMPDGNFVWCKETDPHNVFPLAEPIARAALAPPLCAKTLLRAADEVESHWNQSGRMVNQKEQARRSAEVLRSMARDL